MADYVASAIGHYDPDINQWVLTGYDILYRIGDPDCPYTGIQELPRHLTGLTASFDEPVSAVSWTPSNGLQVKPIDEREYPLTEVPFYGSLMSYLQTENKVLTQLLKAIMAQYPIRPKKECYHAILDALNEATNPPQP